MDKFERDFCAYVPYYLSWSWDKFRDTLELRRWEGEKDSIVARVFTRDGDYSWVVSWVESSNQSNPKPCDSIEKGIDAIIEEIGIKEIRYLRHSGG